MTTTTYTVEQLVQGVRAILARHGGPTGGAKSEILERLRELATRDDLEQLRDQSPNRRLYSEPGGLQLMLATFPEMTAIHNHGAWGVMVGYKGRERYTQWAREDDGSTPGVAKLRIVEDRIVEHGDGAFWDAPPNDIHRQWPEGGPAMELILMGNPPSDVRQYYDLENGTYIEGTPSQMHYRQG